LAVVLGTGTGLGLMLLLLYLRLPEWAIIGISLLVFGYLVIYLFTPEEEDVESGS
jgi:hypothetical protein